MPGLRLFTLWAHGQNESGAYYGLTVSPGQQPESEPDGSGRPFYKHNEPLGQTYAATAEEAGDRIVEVLRSQGHFGIWGG